MSLGFHYYETTCQSLTLQYFDQKESPLVLASPAACLAAASNIAVGALIFVIAPYLSFLQIFLS